jgi:hypothetical protein
MVSRSRFFLFALAFALPVISLGCNQGRTHMTEQQEKPMHRDRKIETASVPLLRKIDADAYGKSIEIDFEVPPQADDAEPPVFIGLRIAAANSSASADAVDRLLDGGVGAVVRLYRLGGAAPEPVVLRRSQWTDRSEVQTVTIGEDGQVPAPFATNADVVSLRAAGLLMPDLDYRELEFAFTRDTPPGDYRAIIEFRDPGHILLREQAELLIAYTAKSR